MREARITADTTLAAKAVSTTDDGDLIVEGYASTWELDRQGESFVPGAFGEAIKSFLAGARPLLYQHEDGRQLGEVEHLEEREKGLWMRARVPQPPEGSPLRHQYNLLKRGMLRGASVRGLMRKIGDKLMMKDLYEISMTPAPVNAGGLVAVAQKALGEEDNGTPPPEDAEEVRQWIADQLIAAEAAFDQVEQRIRAVEEAIPTTTEDEGEKAVTAEQRKKYGMAGGEFPIWHCGSGPGGVGAALSDLGRTKLSRSAVMSHIRRRAKALGCADKYPALRGES
jgi:HK97 family phage prohead protease